MRKRFVVALVAALMAAGTVTAVAASTTTDVACTITDNTLSCPLPVAAPVTETATATVTADPVTVTQDPGTVTVTATVTASPSSSATTPATTSAAPSTTTAATTTAPAGACSGAANDAAGADPWGGCWPGPSNTGATGSLTVVNGDQNYRTANAVITGQDIRGCVAVTAANVTIRNSKITCGSGAAVNTNVTTGRLTLENVTIVCTNGGGASGVGEKFVTVTRSDISGCENGFDADSDITVQDSYIHDLYQSGAAHTDGLQSAFGKNLLIQHNTIYAVTNGVFGTSAIIINMNDPSCCKDTLINRNLVAGGAYTVYCPKSATTNYRLTDNVFSRKFSQKVGAFGPTADCAGEVFTGNVFNDGQPVPQGG